MIKRTIYFGNPAYLSLASKQLVVKFPGEDPSNAGASIPIEDVGVVVIDNNQITLTSGLVAALLDNNVALITCDRTSLPNGLMLPLSGNTLQNERFRLQLSASVPLQKQLWQQTVQMKIANQGTCLSHVTGQVHNNMFVWAGKVKSGDSDNLEARAAAYYWKNLFIAYPDFIRDRDGLPPNNLLNYGYAILRAVMARALVSSGLLPTLGIHHHNRYNAYCLADDIMEPYRPYVDKYVVDIMQDFTIDINELNKDVKAKLLKIPVIDVNMGDKTSPLMVAASQTTASLYRCFTGESRKILYPQMK